MRRPKIVRRWIAAAMLAAGAGAATVAALSPPLPADPGGQASALLHGLTSALAALATPARPEAGPAARPAQPVRVTPVIDAPAVARTRYTGTVRPRIESGLGFRLPGKLAQRFADVGDTVAAGQVLARLDDGDARLDLEAAEAERLAAQTDLARAAADARRSRQLHLAGHVARAVLDRALSAEAEARSRLDRAVRARDLAANRLGYAVLRADAAGVVTAVLAEPGQVVSAGQPVLSVARTAGLDVVFALPEHLRGQLDGARATADLWDAAGAPYALALRDIAPDADPASRTYRVRMAVQDPDARIAFGRSVTVLLERPADASAMLLPSGAVLNDGSGAAVWRLPPGTDRVERVAVEIASVSDRAVTVRGPLAEGDLVISLGAALLDPGRPVRVVETAAPPAL